MAITTKKLGYGGSGEVDGQQVLITSGSFDKAVTVSYINALSIPPAVQSRSRIKHADGIEAYSGSLSFDVTQAALSIFTTSKVLGRYYSFAVGIYDGEDKYRMSNCRVTSLTLSGSAGGLISCSLSFVAASEHSGGSVLSAFIRDTNPPLGYWWSGATDVRDWTFTMNQDAQPVYSNENVTEPKYIKVGLVDYSLQVTTYEQVHQYAAITVATKAFSITGNTVAEGYTFNGPTDLGMYSHSFESAASAGAGSGDTVITVA